jgi:hypothetical protein
MESRQGESQAQFDRRMRTMAIDVCRFLLPASSLANVGMTINARALEHAIGKLLSQPLEETRQIGAEVKQAAVQSVPTLLKYAHEIPYLQNVCSEFSRVQIPEKENSSDWCHLAHVDAQAVARVLAAALYREQGFTYAQALVWVKHAPAEQKTALLNCLLETPDPHTIPSRELESAHFTFDLLIDQGAYFGQASPHDDPDPSAPQRRPGLRCTARHRGRRSAGSLPDSHGRSPADLQDAR